MHRIIIIGAGGQGREIVQFIKDINKINPTWDILGFVVDSQHLQGKWLNGYKVLGTLESLGQFQNKSVQVICAIGESSQRGMVVARLSARFPSLKFATLIHPTAAVAEDASIGSGSMVCAYTVISTNVRIGSHVLVNYGSTIGHDTILQDFCTVLPGSHLSGNVIMRDGAEIGTGGVVIPRVEIGSQTMIGAGAVVVRSLPDRCTAVGVPAKIIKYHRNHP